MSLTYHPTKKIKPHCNSQYDDGGFDANVSAAGLHGLVHQTFGLPTDDRTGIDEGWFRAAYVLDAVATKAAAEKLAKVSDEEIIALLNSKPWIRSHYWAGDETDFVEWVRDWQLFMSKCGGYDTDPPS